MSASISACAMRSRSKGSRWLGEFAREGGFPPGSAWLLRGMLWGGMALVIGYCAKTMYATLKKQPQRGVKVRLPL